MKFLWICLVLAWALALALLIAPYGSPVIEYGFLGIPILAAMILCAFFLSRKGRLRKVLLGFIILGGFSTYLLVTTVSFRDEIIRPKIQGTVICANRSLNHQYPRVEVKNDDGSVVQLEGVSEAFFQTVQLQDRVEKPSGTRMAKIGDKSVAVVEDSLLDVMRSSRE